MIMKYILTLALLVLMVGCGEIHTPPTPDRTTVLILNKETNKVVKVLDDIFEIDESG